MKAFCIIGSPRNNGTTACVVDKIIEGMEQNEIDVEKTVLGQMDIHYCTGCKSCYTSKTCKQHDDMDVIIKRLFEADIILIASPSYWGDVTGQLKVFFDRSTPLCDANGGTLVPKGKVGISVAVRTGQRVEENLHIIHTIEHYFCHLGIKPIKSFTVEGVPYKENFEFRQDKVEEAYTIGTDILNYLEI